MIRPYEDLANAVITQAANDYQFALDELHKDKYNRQAKRVKRECEKFFNSEWFNILTNLDSEVLMKLMQKT